MRIVGIIPARSGSRRLPGKNLAVLGGRPLLAHTCAAAVQSETCAALYFNTDSPAIAAAAAESGVSAPALRPAELATDEAPTRAANQWLLQLLAKRGETFDGVMVLQPTSPLRTADDIRAAAKLFRDHAARAAVVSVVSVAPAGWLGTIDNAGVFQPLANATVTKQEPASSAVSTIVRRPGSAGVLARTLESAGQRPTLPANATGLFRNRSNEAIQTGNAPAREETNVPSAVGPVYRLNGAIYLYPYSDYVADVEPWQTLAYVMPAARSVDIDTYEDLRLAESLMRDTDRCGKGAG